MKQEAVGIGTDFRYPLRLEVLLVARGLQSGSAKLSSDIFGGYILTVGGRLPSLQSVRGKKGKVAAQRLR